MENIETLLAAVAQTQGFDDDEPMASTPSEVRLENSGSSPVVHGDDSGSNVIGEIFGDVRPSAAADTPLPAPTPVVVPVIGDGGRRKRGRPPKGQVAAKPPPPKRAKVEDEEEDVCFICFDGGSLVLCDRKGCPKAYHTTCIKRDEEFFKSKAKWNCGWHICSVCEKASHYMCYTCTYSLCKGCTKDADYLCVRGNKGFCSTCMKTIMLIENKDHATNESVQVDFDDKTSWEYLFKVYWVLLKEKLSLTLSELMQAKKSCKGVAAVACKPQFSNVLHTTVGGEASISYRSTQSMELNKPRVDINLIQNDGLRAEMSSNGNHVEKQNSNKGEHGLSYNKDNVNPNADQVTHEASIDKATDELRIKEATDGPCLEKDRDDSSIAKDSNKPCMCKNTSDGESDRPGIDSTQWASKDLLEFVAHMKNGDTSPISQFDVQKLLLDYIKRNNLRDPSRKSQIICDLRLKNLFGKPRVGHIEMLKLLEYHFLIKEDSQKSSFIPAGVVTSMAGDVKPMASPVGIDDNIYEFPVVISHSHRKRKTRKKGEDRAPQHDLNEYAAIDVHNINLIFLRRNLMENIIEDHENFSNKVIGSIVRIRTNDQKPEVFRLVQVVGTSKVAEPYKIGEKTVDVMLEVLNLDKKEVVSIDAISNQEFTEDECRRLRQSIRCGFVKQFTVGEVQKKALALQSVRVNDWLEAEILRLNHLRDRASEKGHKKKLREYVDRLQLLKSPEERQRRISEVPEIHADPKMNPNYESEEDTRGSNHNEKDEYVKPSYSRFRRNGRKPISPNKKGIEKRSTEAQNRVVEKTDACGSNSTDTHMNQINIDSTETGVRNDQAMQRSIMKTSTATASTGNSPSANNIETEKLWHYRDPNGKIQGPFPMMQLRKWSVTGFFPPDMRIWTNHEQYDSLLLTDALNGKLHGASDLSYKPSSGSRENGAIGGICISEGTHGTSRDDKQHEATGCSMSVLSDNNNALVKVDESASSGWPQCWDLLKDSNSSADDVRARNLLPSSSSGKAVVALTDRDQQSDDLNYVPESVEKNSSGLSQCPMSSGQELQNQSNNEDQAGQSSEENPRSLNIDLSSDGVDSGSVIASASKPPDSSKQAENIEVLDLPSPTSKTENQQPVDADVPMQDSCILELLNPTPRSNNEHQVGHAVDTKQPELLSFPLPSTGPAWIGPPSLGMGGLQLPEVADEWCGYSPTRAKSSVQEWDSGLVSAPSSKPPELACENIDASASESHQFTHVSTSHPVSNMPNWLAMTNEPIEFDAFGEEAVSDLLAAVDAMESRGESQGALPSPTSAMKFARELMEECKDDCFSSIEEFSSPLEPRKSDALSSTSDVQLTSQSSAACKPIGTSPVDAFDSFRRSSVHSSASSEGETNAPVHSSDAGSEYHPPAPNDTNQDMVATAMAAGTGSDAMDPSWGTVQGNINLVTVQGNVNLVLGGPAQGVANLGWGTNHGTAWPNPNMNHSPRNGSLPRDGQRKYSGERFNSPREWGYQGSDSGFGRGRLPWGRQPYGGGGYSRPLPKGQRVCKFYESGRCKKGAFCDYLHP